jgi:hypothetical protein
MKTFPQIITRVPITELCDSKNVGLSFGQILRNRLYASTATLANIQRQDTHDFQTLLPLEPKQKSTACYLSLVLCRS